MSRQEGWLVRRLPVGMQDDWVMARLLTILENVAETVQVQADQIPLLADPTVTPDALLSWLGRFVDAPDTETLPAAERRDLLDQPAVAGAQGLAARTQAKRSSPTASRRGGVCGRVRL